MSEYLSSPARKGLVAFLAVLRDSRNLDEEAIVRALNAQMDAGIEDYEELKGELQELSEFEIDKLLERMGGLLCG